MTISNILFAIDFSNPCRALNSDVEFLAAKFNARVTLLHVFEVPAAWFGSGDVPLVSGDDLMSFAQEEQKRLDTYPIGIPDERVQRIATEGSAGGDISSWANSNGVDLVVMGTHGYGQMGRILLGSVAMKVLHEVNCPVWMRHTDAVGIEKVTANISNILCSVDLSDEMVPLLHITRDLATAFGASVTLAHCMIDGRQDLAQEEMARGEIDQLQDRAGTEFPVDVREGDSASQLGALAREKHVDLIIIGRGKARDTLGTIRTYSSEIIHEAPCAVLSVSTGR